jgi:hypothetical protein
MMQPFTSRNGRGYTSTRGMEEATKACSKPGVLVVRWSQDSKGAARIACRTVELCESSATSATIPVAELKRGLIDRHTLTAA